MAFATLSIDFEAKLANLEQGLDRAARQAEQSAARTNAALGGITKSINFVRDALGAYLTVKYFDTLIFGSIDAADHLNDLAKKAQLSVSQIGGVGFAAEQAGSNADDAAAGLGKLNLAISKAAGGNKEIATAFQRMGVSFTDAKGRARDTTAVLLDLADKFSGYEDGPQKAALANAVFGKSYQSILPLLDDGRAALQSNIDYFNQYSGITSDSAQAADEFNDKLTKLHLLQKAFGQELSQALLPVMGQLVDMLIESKEKGGATSIAIDGLRIVLETITTIGVEVTKVFRDMGAELGGMAAKAVVLGNALQNNPFNTIRDLMTGSGSPVKGQWTAISDMVQADLDRASKARDRGVARIFGNAPDLNPFANLAFDATGTGGGKAKGKAPGLPGKAEHQRTTEIERLIQKLQDQTIAELTAGDAAKETEKVMLELATNPKLATATKAQRAAVLNLADGIDQLRAKSALMNSDLENFRKSEARSADSIAEGVRADAIEKMDKLHQLIQQTPTRQLEDVGRDLAMLNEELEKGNINWQTFNEAAIVVWSKLPPAQAAALTEMEQRATDAAHSLTDTLGNTLEDVLGGNFDRIGSAWKSMLIKMAADAVRTDLGKLIFGAGSGDTGLWGSLLKWVGGLGGSGEGAGGFASVAGISGGRAGGGSVAPGAMPQVNELAPETVTVQGRDFLLPSGRWRTVNRATGGGDGGAPIVFNIASGVSRNELAALVPQLEARIMATMTQRMRRPGFSGG